MGRTKNGIKIKILFRTQNEPEKRNRNEFEQERLIQSPKISCAMPPPPPFGDH